MKAIELFPYWNDNRALLTEIAGRVRDEELDVRPAEGLRSAGDVLRHVIGSEERWWHGGIHGRPYDAWRPPGWEQMSPEERQQSYRRRFPTIRSILEGLEAAHAPVQAFLEELDAADLCEKRQATWGEPNTLRWILWHLVEHDQHHRGQLCTRLRMLGHTPPQIWPRAGVMRQTPAGNWRLEEAAIADIVPFWKQLHASMHRAVGALSDADLAYTHAPGRPTIHDLVLHIFIWEDFLVRQNLGGQMGTASGGIQGWFWKSDVTQISRNVGAYFPTVAALLDGMDAVHRATRAFIEKLDMADLAKTVGTPRGPEAVHHVLWYAREHTVHHRGQLFFRMRMAGRTPPEI